MTYLQTIDKNWMFLTENAKIFPRSLRSLVIVYENFQSHDQGHGYSASISMWFINKL